MSDPVSQLDVAGAITEQEVLSWWQDWYRFLTARLDLLDLRVVEDASEFDHDDQSATTRRSMIEAALRAIPEPRRAAFEAEVEHYRQSMERQQVARGTAGQPVEDGRQVERQALLKLIEICKGDAAQNKLGQVPVNDRWWEVDPSALETVPEEAFYAIGKQTGRPAPMRYMLVGVAILFIGVIFWFLSTDSSSSRTSARSLNETMAVNGQDRATWTPRAATITHTTGDPVELALQPIPSAGWPKAPTAQVGGWREGRIWPLELCIPHQMITGSLASLTLQSAEATPARTYTLSTDKPTNAPIALRLVACDGNGDLLRYGTLVTTTPNTAATVGEGYPLPNGGEVTVAQVAVVGRGQEMSVPLQKALVYVDVQAPGGVDWPALNPRLTLQDGTVVATSDTVQDMGNGRARITHLIDLPTSPLAAAWDVTDPASQQVLRWRITLAPPRSRAAQLAASVEITGIAADLGADNRVTVRLRLKGRGDAPIVITSDDLALRQGDLTLQTPAILPVEVAPGAEVPLRLDLVIDPTQPLQLMLGGAAYALVLPERG